MHENATSDRLDSIQLGRSQVDLDTNYNADQLPCISKAYRCKILDRMIQFDIDLVIITCREYGS